VSYTNSQLPNQQFIRNVVQVGDCLTRLRSLPDRCAPLAFFDPQHRTGLDYLNYGNERARQKKRFTLPAMSDSYISDSLREIAQVLTPSGYLMLWCDTYNLCQAQYLQIADVCPTVDLISWDSLRMGMGYRTRKQGDYLLIAQKPPIRAKATWADHGVPNRWSEKVDRTFHPHIKPFNLTTRLIGAVTKPGDLVLDPAAGSFTVMRAAHRLGREFIGCDLIVPERMPESPSAKNLQLDLFETEARV
jgi:site-specific DNA-methyltransferase (adenine-specific)